MNNDKGTPMTQAQEIAELRTWLREDIGNLHKQLTRRDQRIYDKIDGLHEQITKIATESRVNGTKIVGLASVVSLMVSSIILAAFQIWR